MNGIKHNDFPSQIMKVLHENGITSLPSYTQLNNKIVYLRKSHEIHGNITTSTELKGAISKHTEIHVDDKIHKPYVKN